MKHHTASGNNLILHQLDWQDQPQLDTPHNKTLLWRSRAVGLLGAVLANLPT